MFRSFILSALVMLAALVTAPSAHARNILISNDDGLTANVKALYDALKAAGHDVIVALPCSGQSGMGGALRLMKPIGPLAQDCLNGAAQAGAAGVGMMTRPGLGPDFHYVDGTPVMALLYGIDIVGQKRWGKAPDLVLSGPNIGQNAGPIVISSGTNNNAQYAMMRGIPAIALSASENSASKDKLDYPISVQVAARVMQLLARLEQASGNAALLPAGLGLNVNFPADLSQAGWKLAKIGTYSPYDIKFVADIPTTLGQTPDSQRAPLPGLTIRSNQLAATPEQQGDEALMAKRDITVSLMQLAYGVSDEQAGEAGKWLAALLEEAR